MLRHLRTRVSRDEFIVFVGEHSDAAHNVHVVDQRSGNELTLYRSRTGHELGLAVYPAGGMRPYYRVKAAHALALVILGLVEGGTAQAASTADPFPPAAIAEERENHALSIQRPGHPIRCVAYVSTRNDGTVLVTLATTDGKPLTRPLGPYPSEQIAMIDMIGAHGREC